MFEIVHDSRQIIIITTLFRINVPYFFVINKEIGNINMKQSGNYLATNTLISWEKIKLRGFLSELKDFFTVEYHSVSY